MRLQLIPFTLFAVSSLIGAPNQRRYEYGDVRGSLTDIQHEVGNQQMEMKVFEERLDNLDVILESVQTDLSSLKQLQKDKLGSAAREMDGRIGTLDLSTKSAVADIKALKSQVNEGAAVSASLKARLGSLEKLFEAQNQNIDALQAAVRGLAEALQIKEGIKATKAYAVKSGDALEKIARAHQMTIEEIKELNGLTGTKIIVGQKLLVYDK